MQEVSTKVPHHDELLIVKFREQFLLFADRPLRHWAYQAENQAQIQASAQWIQEAPNRWLLAPTRLRRLLRPNQGHPSACVTAISGPYRADALRPTCQQAKGELTLYRYDPQHGYQ